MNIRKGHVTGFLATVLVFGAIFLYIYLGTMETGWLYNLKDKTKENIGKNISNVVIDSNEEYIASISIKGALKLSPINNLHKTLFSKKDVNKCFFVKDLLVLIDKDGNASSFNIKTKEKNNYKIDCYNKYVCVIGEKLYTIDPGVISEVNLIKNNNYKENKVNFSFSDQSDIVANDNFIGIFREKKLDLLLFPNFEKMSIDLDDYASMGQFYIDDINKIVTYINLKGEVVLNNKGNNIVLDDILNPQYISITKNNLIVASKKEMVCYDILGNKLWKKDMMCDGFTVNNKGDNFINIYVKAQAGVYDVQDGEEIYSLESLKKAKYSPKDNYIVGYQKSIY